MAVTLEQFGLDRLGPDERRELIELLLESLPPEAEGPVRVPDWHWPILAERIAQADADPGGGIPLEELRRELLGDQP